MNKKNLTCLIIILALECLSCQAPVKKKNAVDSFLTAVNAIELDNRLKAADSLVVVFYKDPYGADSLRYTRYYKQFATTDTNSISMLLANMTEPFTKLEKVKKCRSEGKIWCFTKGNVFQTVYFSTHCNDCCHLFVIKDGFFFYMKLKENFLDKITQLKVLSKEA